MTDFELGKSTKLQTIAIRVKDRDKAISFYRDILGFDLKREENELAIFGFKGTDGEVIWLEESPRANDHFGEIKKMQRIRLSVASLEELAAICKKAKTQEATFEESVFEGNQIAVVLADPEENRIEVFYEGPQESSLPQTLEALIEVAPSELGMLSNQARFNQVHLNVSDVAKERSFLEQLGLTTKATDGFLHLNEDDFQIGLVEGQGGTIDLPTHEVLGLDFLKITINQEDLLTLEAHLTANQQEFFIDKKKHLLTTYDAIGIEWWFIVNK
ncbi:VOC family protein [Enterococcus sp.]|uniref:VOC family protein n=1 Tax=Enterococcus sp. TaxID=35783 RepID=UPI0025C2E633|nr:VOC family protein [Enterococcus sp.]